MRALMAIIVVIFIFWCGFEFGEIRASVGRHHYGYNMMQKVGGGMIRYNNVNVHPTAQLPVATSTKTK